MPVASSYCLSRGPGRGAVDLVQVIVEAAGVEGGLAEDVRQIDVVDRQDLPDDVEHAVVQHGASSDRAFRAGVPRMRPSTMGCPSSECAGHKVEGVDVPLLADAVDAAEALLQAGRVPRQVVIDHQPAELEVDPLARRLGRHADLLLRPELLLEQAAAACGFMPPWISAGAVAPCVPVTRRKVIQRIPVLGEDEQFAPPVAQFLEFGPLQAKRFEGQQASSPSRGPAHAGRVARRSCKAATSSRSWSRPAAAVN